MRRKTTAWGRLVWALLVGAHPALGQLGAPSVRSLEDAGRCDVFADGPEHTCSRGGPGFVCFSGCNHGSLDWTNWTDPNEQGILVQFSRPNQTDSGRPLGPRSCVKLVVTEATNVLVYILVDGQQSFAGNRCGERIGRDDGHILHWDDPAGGSRISWFNASGANASQQRFELALLDDVDQSGKDLQLTLRPNPLPGNDSDAQWLNFSSLKFSIESCNITAPVTDRALFLTVALDLTGLVIAFAWVTCSWACFGQVRHWRDMRESRRQSVAGGGGGGGCCFDFHTRASGIDDEMLDDLLGHQNAAMDREVTPVDEDESDSQHVVLRRRARQRAWRADFMAKHRLTWPYYVWVEPDSTILRVAGQRALQYMEFQWAVIRLPV